MWRLISVLLLLWCIGVTATHVVLPVAEQQFVRVHIGLPGDDMWLQLRWDLPFVAIFAQSNLRSKSRSWSADSTDVVCFQTFCKRLPLVIDWLPSVPDDPTVLAPLGARSHDGVLGLSGDSPLWSLFVAWRMSQRDLVLFTNDRAAPSSHHRMWHYSTSLVPITAEGERAWARVDMSSDYTQVPWAFAHEQQHWTLELRDDSGRRRVARLEIHPGSFGAIAQDGGQIHLMRAIEGGHNSTVDVAQQPALAAGWPLTSRHWTLGAALLRDGFVVQQNVASGQMQLACKWLYSAALTPLDQLVWLLVFLPLDILWVYGIYDSVDFVERLELGSGNKAASVPLSVLSYRHRGFSAVLTLATQLVVLMFLFALTLGYGVGSEPFWHEQFGAYDRAAIYSTVAVAAVVLPALWLLPLYPSTTAIWGSTTLVCCIWLVAALDPFRLANSVVMALAGALLSARLCMQFIDLVLAQLWPWRVYSRRKWLWATLLGVLAAWSVWLFAFYTVRLVTLSWRADHPGVWAICTVAALLIVFIAHRLVNQHHTVLAEQHVAILTRRLNDLK